MVQAFLSAYRSWGRFQGEKEVTTGLYRIVVTICFMKLQKGQNGWYLTQTGYEDRHVVD